ncbi:unnamed protein product [Cuscuta epithymum]|uniref:Uncharacterized protein n=1 Tax=Cuscuta epithymum TaxID=186058 RepID=A0AAV0GCM1_9ASTE|nr:unnamed protein product [Cuscuta epithymum]
MSAVAAFGINSKVQETISMSSMNDLEKCCLILAIEEEVKGLVSGESTWIERGGGSGGGMGYEKMERGEGLSKVEDISAVRQPPEPPPWSDRGARVWKIYQLFNFLWFSFALCFMFFCFLLMSLVLGLQL